MTQNIIVMLTEGDHDAAFLYRILRANGFEKFSKPIKEFPKLLQDLFSRDILQVSIPEVSLQFIKSRFLPSNVVTEGKNILLIYSLGGDTKSKNRKKLIEEFNTFNTKDSNEIQVSTEIGISILYFLDSDNNGIDKRFNEIDKELREAFDGNDFEKIDENASLKMIDDINMGIYIFTEEGKQTGKLEDVLIPMMEDGNEKIFNVAKTFLSIHENTTLYKGQLKYYEGTKTIHKVFNDKYDSKKSIIGTIGQLHKSGKSNTVCISDAEYLNNDKIKANSVCNEIISFIRKAMK